jgi:hypothetical protein
MVTEQVKSLNDYLTPTGYTGELVNGLDQLSLVNVRDGHYCWRFKNKFVFFDIGDISEGDVGLNVKKLRKKLQTTPHLELITNIFEFRPTDETISFVMMKLSPIYKVFVTDSPPDGSLVTLRNHCNNFMNSIPHIYKTYIDNVYQYKFFDIPGITGLVNLFVTKFYTKMREIINSVGDKYDVMIHYWNIIKDPNIQNNNSPLSSFRRACSTTVPVIIKRYNQITSILFTTCNSALFNIIDTFRRTLSQVDYSDLIRIFTTHIPPTTPIKVSEKLSPIKKIRPVVKKHPRKTWRDKRPSPINTNLKVNMDRCIHTPRRSKKRHRGGNRRSIRIAKLNPRRSVRLKK